MYLLSEARRKKLSGTGLKVKAGDVQTGEQKAIQIAGNFFGEDRMSANDLLEVWYSKLNQSAPTSDCARAMAIGSV